MRQKGSLLLVAALVVLCGAAPVFGHEVMYNFPLEEDPGWTAIGAWERGNWDGCGGMSPEVCSAPAGWGAHGGYSFYGHDLTLPLGDLSTAEILTTTALDCRGWEDVTLSFWRMLGAPLYTPASVRVSYDGYQWITVWQSAGNEVDSDWTFCSYDISTVADNQPTVYVQWVMGPSAGGACPCYGFDIDDVTITGDRAPANDLIYSFPLSYGPGWTMTGAWEWGSADDCCNEGGQAFTGTTWFKHGSATQAGDISGKYGPGITDTLTTSPIDCTGLTSVHVNFWRMLGLANYSGPHDEASVQVSSDGATWTTVWWTQDYFGNWASDDAFWQYCDYDISAVADGQPTVYVRWVMGPTDDDACACYGWELDDINITAKTLRPPLQVLAWVRYADLDGSYPNTVAAVGEAGEPCAITESYTYDPAALARELEGKQVRPRWRG